MELQVLKHFKWHRTSCHFKNEPRPNLARKIIPLTLTKSRTSPECNIFSLAYNWSSFLEEAESEEVWSLVSLGVPTCPNVSQGTNVWLIIVWCDRLSLQHWWWHCSPTNRCTSVCFFLILPRLLDFSCLASHCCQLSCQEEWVHKFYYHSAPITRFVKVISHSYHNWCQLSWNICQKKWQVMKTFSALAKLIHPLLTEPIGSGWQLCLCGFLMLGRSTPADVYIPALPLQAIA